MSKYKKDQFFVQQPKLKSKLLFSNNYQIEDQNRKKSFCIADLSWDINNATTQLTNNSNQQNTNSSMRCRKQQSNYFLSKQHLLTKNLKCKQLSQKMVKKNKCTPFKFQKNENIIELNKAINNSKNSPTIDPRKYRSSLKSSLNPMQADLKSINALQSSEKMKNYLSAVRTVPEQNNLYLLSSKKTEFFNSKKTHERTNFSNSDLLIKLKNINFNEAGNQYTNFRKKQVSKNQLITMRKKNRQKFQKQKQKMDLCQYDLFELFGYYHSLIEFSQGNLRKFLKGFQLILNLQNITIRQQIIKQCFQTLPSHQIFSFSDFLKIYKKIHQLLLRQNILDYMEIIFENSNRQQLNYEQIKNIFQKRCFHTQAEERASIIYNKLGKEHSNTISLNQILNLCQNDQAFCSYMHALYLKEIKLIQ